MFYSLIIQVQTQEVQILLAIKAIQISKQKLSCCKAIEIYTIPKSILYYRMSSKPPYSNSWPKVQNLI